MQRRQWEFFEGMKGTMDAGEARDPGSGGVSVVTGEPDSVGIAGF